MIIRVIGDGQYAVDSCLYDRLNGIDNRIVDHVQAGDEAAFRAGLSELVGTVTAAGRRLDGTEFCQSDVVVPPADLTLAEARDLFAGDGIFAD